MEKPFDLKDCLHQLAHYLPSQSPLKDFIHHNSLHAFQDNDFFSGLFKASRLFGYQSFLAINEFRRKYNTGAIRQDILERVIAENEGKEKVAYWKELILHSPVEDRPHALIGALRSEWKNTYFIDLDSAVYPLLFRLLNAYLDQGIALWKFPKEGGFLNSLRQLEQNSQLSIFQTKQARARFLDPSIGITQLLEKIVGRESLFEQYLFDQQFAHPGWSGMIATLEDKPQSLLDRSPIALEELILLELHLEWDALDALLYGDWHSLGNIISPPPPLNFETQEFTLEEKCLRYAQLALEWSFYDQVLAAFSKSPSTKGGKSKEISFQALFCIDDRECSLRRNLESQDPLCQTFGTPGFFNMAFYFQPEGTENNTKVCPAPMHPPYLIKELGSNKKKKKDLHLSRRMQSIHNSTLMSQTMGFWSAIKLFFNLFKPSISPATSSSFNHMSHNSELSIDASNPPQFENNLQLGFSLEEQLDRLEGQLRSIGLIDDFAPLVYFVAHGASSVNNPYYAAYDCGACSGRPGSVNARVISHIANKTEVRQLLAKRGIHIPDSTRFVGALHDTTQDDIVFYDAQSLPPALMEKHLKNVHTFEVALDFNAKERSRRLELVNSKKSAAEIHKKLRLRAVSLFEPRPELNHATNALCVVAPRNKSLDIFLDRRAFLNSYEPELDVDGSALASILNAATPVCGGINLEYYFSRVDNHKLGAGSKLPHNVMGLIGVANGIDGDLRTGLPIQMIEIHDPLRLMMIVYAKKEKIDAVLAANPKTADWYQKEWTLLSSIDPETQEVFTYSKGDWHLYNPLFEIKEHDAFESLFEKSPENLPVYKIKK